VLVLFAFFAGRAGAATINVANGDQLADAVKSAANGDTIELTSYGIYAPDKTLEVKTSLTIEGPSVQGPSGGPAGAILSGANVPNNDSPALIVVDNGASLTLRNVSLRLAQANGAAVDVSGSLDLSNADVTQNSSVAAIMVENDGTATIRNTTVANNLGTGVDVFGTASLVNDTVAFNKGNGLFVEHGSTVAITNTVVASNGSSRTNSHDCSAAVSSSASSFDGDGSCQANQHGNALLGSVNYQGGPTATIDLKQGSPLIGAGLGSACPTNDQRSAPRSGGCDIGAFQYGATPPPPAKGPESSSSGGGGGGQATTTTPAVSTSPASSSSNPAAKKPVTTVKTPTKLQAYGSIRIGKGGKATFRLSAATGNKAGFVSFVDPTARISLRASKLVSVSQAHGTFTLRGTGLELRSNKHFTFRITVAPGKPGTFHIVVGKVFSAGGSLSSGAVSLKA
jgi:hypothetical protein